MDKFLALLDQFFEREKQENFGKGKLKKKYLKILQVFVILLVIEVGIGKINGGEQKTVLKGHAKITSVDNDQIAAQLTQRENLKNGASQLVFKMTTSDFDYQKKRLVVTQDKKEIKGKLLNRRYFSIQTKSFEKFTTLQVKLYSLEGEEESLVLNSRFNLKAEAGKLTAFPTLKTTAFNKLLVNGEIKKTIEKKAKNQKQIGQLEEMIELDHQSIQKLQAQIKDTEVEADKNEMLTQIDHYQESIQTLDHKMKSLTEEVQTEEEALTQLKTQEKSYHG